MPFLHNIRTVARYEAKTLRRSWFFRLFSIGALTIFTFMNIGMFSPIGDESWIMVSISSTIPLVNLYLLNIGQAIIVIFLAADFLKRDKKLDTNEVLYTRSMSNFEYLTGKTIGILRLFLGLDIIILSIALIINIISKVMTVDILAYLWYLLIICVPTIVFSLGLAFMLMSVIRNQAVTFLILLGFAALDIFWLWYRAGFIFDYMAFGLPVFKSGIIGFDNPGFILNQRFLFLFLGLALVFATVLLFKRLPQSKLHTGISVVLLVVFTAGAVICGYNTFSSWKNNIDERNLVVEINRKFENTPFPRMTDASLDIRHSGYNLEASAHLKFINDNDEKLMHYVFSLNPGLVVSDVSSNGGALNFTQTNHIVEIDPVKPLESGETDSVIVSYSGSIKETFCYPDHTENYNESPYRIEMLNVNKRQAFLSDSYVLLTPETYWYPFAGLNYYPSNPARIKVDFTKFSLRVKTEPGLSVVSQGKKRSGDGYDYFTADSPVTGLTLAIGNYLSDTVRTDSVSYITHYFPGNDYYKKDLSEIRDTLPLLISGIMRELETNFSTTYPFGTLSLLEVPVQFYSYPRMSTQTRAELQPSMVLVPERLSTLQNAGFRKRFTRQKRNMIRNNQVITDKELQVRLFNDFIRNTFISGTNFRFVNGMPVNEPTRYRLGPSFYFFKNNFYSTEYPVINATFESHLQKVSALQPGFIGISGGLPDNDKANLILRNGSFRDILAKNPGGDTIRIIVTVKGDYLFNLLRSKAGIEEFNVWFRKYIDDHKFTSVDIRKLNDDINKEFGFEFYPYLSNWFNRKEQPGFLFTDIQANEIVVGDRLRYLVSFVASNPEPVAGIFNVSFRTGGPSAGGRQMTIDFIQGGGGGGGRSISISSQGRGMDASDISKIVVMEPGEAKRIKRILDSEPRTVMINTIFARNLPGEITIPITEIKKSKNKTAEDEDEEKLDGLPEIFNRGDLIVDNEDQGFNAGSMQPPSPLKKLLRVKARTYDEYENINMFWAPEIWQKAIQSSYYGKYILSSAYTRKGAGDRSVTWSVKLYEPGYYDIYCYIGKSGDRVVVRTGISGGAAPPPPPGPGETGNSGDSPFRDMHYKIYHDEGIDEIMIDFENAEAGWNSLGRYYLSDDTAKVELTNQSAGRIVLGDAIRWVKAN